MALSAIASIALLASVATAVAPDDERTAWMQSIEGVETPAQMGMGSLAGIINAQLNILNVDIDISRRLDVSESEQIERVKTSVTNKMRDPDSAKFRYVEAYDFGEFRLVCGQVNAKNAYGGYAGYKSFVGAAFAPIIEGTDKIEAATVSFVEMAYCKDGLSLGKT